MTRKNEKLLELLISSKQNAKNIRTFLEDLDYEQLTIEEAKHFFDHLDCSCLEIKESMPDDDFDIDTTLVSILMRTNSYTKLHFVLHLHVFMSLYMYMLNENDGELAYIVMGEHPFESDSINNGIVIALSVDGKGFNFRDEGAVRHYLLKHHESLYENFSGTPLKTKRFLDTYITVLFET